MTSQDLYCSHTIIQIVKWNKTSTSHLVWKRKFGERRGRKKGNKELTLQGRWHQQWKRHDEPEKGFLHHTRRTNRSVLHFLTYSMHQQQREIQSLVSRKWRSQEENEETPESYLEVIIPSCECEFRYKSLRVCISPFVRMSCHLILTSNLPCPVRTFSQSSPSCQSYSLSFSHDKTMDKERLTFLRNTKVLLNILGYFFIWCLVIVHCSWFPIGSLLWKIRRCHLISLCNLWSQIKVAVVFLILLFQFDSLSLCDLLKRIQLQVQQQRFKTRI